MDGYLSELCKTQSSNVMLLNPLFSESIVWLDTEINIVSMLSRMLLNLDKS